MAKIDRPSTSSPSEVISSAAVRRVFTALTMLVRSADGLAKLQFLQFTSRQHVDHMNDPLRQFLWIFCRIRLAIGCQCELSRAANRFGSPDAIGHLTLNGHRLEIRRRLLKNERHVGAAHRHGHQRRGWRIVKERQSQTFADDFAAAILQQVGGGLDFDELYAEHNMPFV